MASDIIPPFLVEYVERQRASRAEAVNGVLSGLTDRELALMKEVATMGYVQGIRHPEGGRVPKNSEILALVIDACLSFSDLYPVVNAGPPEPCPQTEVHRGHLYQLDFEDSEIFWCSGLESS